MTLDTQQSFLLQARLCKNSRYIWLYNPVRKSVKIISFFSAVIIPATDIAIDVQVIAISTKNVWITTPNITGNLGLHPSTPSQAVNPNKDSVVSRGQQHSINFTGHTISTEGICGDGLEKAVKQFQSDRGLTVDGIAGRNTILKLIRC